jgi:C-terminal processing protease CtpA/Prc
MRQWWLVILLCSTSACSGSTETSGSIGARLGRDNDDHALYVREVPEGYAAAAAGLEPGDEVVMIDGVYVRTMSPEELKTKLRGPIDSEVALTLTRGTHVLHVRLKRSKLREGSPPPKAKEERIEE